MLRQARIARTARLFSKFDQRKFNFLMSGISLALLRRGTKPAVDQIRKAARHVQKRALARGVGIGNRRFHQMPRAVQLMILTQARPFLSRMRQLVIRVDIAVRPLRRRDQGYHPIRLFLQRGIGLYGKHVGHRFQPLV